MLMMVILNFPKGMKLYILSKWKGYPAWGRGNGRLIGMEKVSDAASCSKLLKYSLFEFALVVVAQTNFSSRSLCFSVGYIRSLYSYNV